MEHGSSKSGRQEVTADIRTCGTQQGKWFLRIVSLSECTASRSVFRMSTQWGSPVLQLNNILCHSTQQNQTFFFFKTWHTGFMAPSCGESEHYMSCERAAYADALKTELLLWAWKEPHHSPGSTIQVSNNSVWGRCGRLSLESAALKAISILFELPEICGFLRVSLTGQWRWQNASRPRTKTRLSSPHLQNRARGRALVCRGVAGVLQVLFQTEPLRKHPSPRQ